MLQPSPISQMVVTVAGGLILGGVALWVLRPYTAVPLQAEQVFGAKEVNGAHLSAITVRSSQPWQELRVTHGGAPVEFMIEDAAQATAEGEIQLPTKPRKTQIPIVCNITLATPVPACGAAVTLEFTPDGSPAQTQTYWVTAGNTNFTHRFLFQW